MNIKAYAKVNFVLNINGRRDDGYHDVETVMQAIDLYDVVSLNTRSDSEFCIALQSGDDKVPDDQRNLAWKAAASMHDAFHSGKGECIIIEILKRIPVAAGLAGGSADAAAVIWGLGRLWGVPEEKLYPIAAAIGSDVPFCLAVLAGHTAAIASGTGTELTFIPPTDCKLLLAPADFELSTKDVYAAADELSMQPAANTGAFRWNAPLRVKAAAMSNHLEPAAISLKPEISATLEQLRSIGTPLYTGLSGSGPTCFSVYHKTEELGTPENMILVETYK